MKFHASDNEITESGDKDNPLRASGMRDSRHTVKPMFQNELNLDETIVINENSDEED